MDGNVVKLKFNPEVDFCPGCGALLPRLVPARTLCTFRLVALWLSINPLLLMELLLGEREITGLQINFSAWRLVVM